MDANGGLLPLVVGESLEVPDGMAVLADVKCHDGSPGWLVSRSPRLAVNGIRPLWLGRLEPGDLFSYGSRHWLVVVEWTPEPQPAPPHLAERPCPVCGGPLGLAPTCQCPCGGPYCHLENPAAPDDPKALNCYLRAPCGSCKHEHTLQPTLVPEPDEKLLGQELE